MRPNRGWGLAVLLGIASLTVAGCGGDDVEAAPFVDLVEAGPPGAPEVLMIGDSISYVSFPELTARFNESEWNHAITGDVGSTTEENRAKIRGAIEGEPDVIVVQLGTNDAGLASNPSNNNSLSDVEESLERASREIGSAMEDLRTASCVVWVDVNTWTHNDLYDMRVAGPAINETIHELAGIYPNVSVAPYAAFFAPRDTESREWLEDNYDPDLLHPESPESRQALAALIADTISKQCDV